MDSRELVWRYAMNEAQRLTGGKSGHYSLDICNDRVGVIVTNNGSDGTSYAVSGPHSLRMFGWRVNDTLEPFIPRIHAKGAQWVYDMLSGKVYK